MRPTVVLTEENIPEGREAILDLLGEFNLQNAPDPDFRLLGLLLKDEQGATIGGLWGRSAYEWLFIELLFVPDNLRGSGVGTQLMRQAEEIARERHCTGVWLDTFAFQALPFYQKLGYTVFGELKDHPRGISQYWLQKRFDEVPSV
jgi:GNAT superfamily N-acetyltransferase